MDADNAQSIRYQARYYTTGNLLATWVRKETLQKSDTVCAAFVDLTVQAEFSRNTGGSPGGDEMLLMSMGVEGEGEGEGEGQPPDFIPRDCDLRCGYHDADYDPVDWFITINELWRFIAFFRMPDGYYLDAAGEDCFSPGVGNRLGQPHSGDTGPSGAPDWHISLSELLRVVQFFNSGGYSIAGEPTEDGFEPGSDGSQQAADTEAPVITLTGGAVVQQECAGELTYKPTAWDSCDGDISYRIDGDTVEEDTDPGTYNLTYTVSDTRGNPATAVTQTVIVEDTLPPAITMNGGDVLAHCQGAPYTDAGATASDFCAGVLTVQVDNQVNVNELGTHEVHYNVADASGNPAVEVIRYVTIVNEPPQLALLGDSLITVECGGVYNEPGATAMDDCDGDISGDIQVSGTVDTGVLGDHLLSYTVSDSFGNPAAPVVRTVTVVDTTPPVIALTGGASVTACQGQPFTDPGSTVTDNCDTGLTATVTGTVDTSTLGDYTLTYNATDTSSNHAVAVERTVTVEVDDPPTVLLVGERVIVHPCNTPFVDQGAIVVDDCDPDGVIYASPIDTSQAAAHVLTYSYTDSAGHTTEAERLVIVDCVEDVSADIPDLPLRNAILSALQKPPATPMSPSELRQITELEAVNLGITNLEGMEYLQGLTNLDLHHNQLNDIAALRFNEALIDLDLHGNGVNNLDSLVFMSDLETLNLHDNAIVNITPLQNLLNLNIVYLSRNEISNINPLVDNAGLEGDGTAPDFDRWDRINIILNPIADSTTNKGLVDQLTTRGASVSWKPVVQVPKSYGSDYTGQFSLYYDHGAVSLETFRVVEYASNPPTVASGSANSLRVTDENDVVVSVPAVFSLEFAGGDHDDPGIPQAPDELVLEETSTTVRASLTGAIRLVEYIDDAGAPHTLFSTMEKAAGMGQGGLAAIKAVDGADDAIPIGVHLIHGDENIPDDKAFVIVLMGDAYTVNSLGDPTYTVGPVVGGLPAWSRVAGHMVDFLLSEQPFDRYAQFLKIYRVDFISRDGSLRDPTHPDRQTALRMFRNRGDDEWVTGGADAANIVNHLELSWDRYAAVANDGGAGNSDIRTHANIPAYLTGRTMVAIHELGHAIGRLVDEYEYIHATCNDCNGCNSDAPSNLLGALYPNVVSRAGDGIVPQFDDIPWRHWLTDNDNCSLNMLGTALDLGTCDPKIPDPVLCGCEYLQSNCDTPLPTCEANAAGDLASNGHVATLGTPTGCPNPVVTNITGRAIWPEPRHPDAKVGLYEGAYRRWWGAYRPQLRCRMRSGDDTELGSNNTTQFCVVCRENLTLQILASSTNALREKPVNETVSYSIGENVTFEVKVPGFGLGPGAQVTWRLDGNQIAVGGYSLILDTSSLSGTHSLSVSIVDTTDWVQQNNQTRIQDKDRNLHWPQDLLGETISWTLVPLP
jgi:hypothetical protein